MAVALAVPLQSSVIIGEITLDKLSEFMSHLPGEAGFITLILDRHGHIVADSDLKRFGQQLDSASLPPIHRDDGRPYSFKPFDLYGTSVLGNLVEIHPLEWKVLFAQPVKTAYKSMTVAFITLATGLGAALIIAMMAAWFLAVKLSEQFKLYIRYSQDIAQGIYDLEMPSSRTMEMANLGQNLKKMARKINRREKALKIHQFNFDKASIGIHRIASDARFLDVNNHFAETLGYTREELLEMSIFDIDPGVDSEIWKDRWQNLIKIGKNHFETLHQNKDGQTIPMEITSNLLEYEGRKFAMCFTLDISERKKAENELKSLRNYLSNIIDSMPSILVGVDIEGRVTQWNKTVEKTTGIPAAAARGKMISDILPQMRSEQEKIIESIRTRQIIRKQKKPVATSNGTFYEDITIYPLITNGVESAVIRIDDVTEKVRLEEMMIQSEKMISIGGLAAGMAHEINNPLGIILQSTQNMSRRLGTELAKNRTTASEIGLDLDTMQQYLRQRSINTYLESIKVAGERAAKIVKSMLAFSRKSESKKALYNINSIFEQVLEMAANDYDLKKTYDFRSVEIHRDYGELPDIICTETEIAQVFLNIVKNAAQAMARHQYVDAGPRISVKTRVHNNRVVVSIKDNGPGIDGENQKKIFEPFHTTKPPGEGTGLGLSVSYFIITTHHGGTISVQSRAGGGTCFMIELPI